MAGKSLKGDINAGGPRYPYVDGCTGKKQKKRTKKTPILDVLSGCVVCTNY